MIEPMKQTTREYRKKVLEAVGNNPLRIRSEDVFIDMIVDCGRGAMSYHQWSSMMIMDHICGCSKSFNILQKAVYDIFDFKYTILCHQGRKAENLLFPILLAQRQKIYSHVTQPSYLYNNHMDYIVECFINIKYNLKNLQPLEFEYETPILRHFTLRLKTKIEENFEL